MAYITHIPYPSKSDADHNHYRGWNNNDFHLWITETLFVEPCAIQRFAEKLGGE